MYSFFAPPQQNSFQMMPLRAQKRKDDFVSYGILTEILFVPAPAQDSGLRALQDSRKRFVVLLSSMFMSWKPVVLMPPCRYTSMLSSLMPYNQES